MNNGFMSKACRRVNDVCEVVAVMTGLTRTRTQERERVGVMSTVHTIVEQLQETVFYINIIGLVVYH